MKKFHTIEISAFCPTFIALRPVLVERLRRYTGTVYDGRGALVDYEIHARMSLEEC